MDSRTLVSIGLTEYEASAYLALIELGPSPVKAISEKSKVPPTATYPALRSLVRKGFVQELLGEPGSRRDPKRFGALDPKIAIAAHTERRISIEKEGSERALEAILSFTDALSKKGKVDSKGKSPFELISISSGYESSREITKSLFGRTKQSFLIAGWGFGNSKNKKDFETIYELSKLVKQGVSVKFLVGNIEPGSERKVREYSKIGILLRKTDLTNFSLVISDASECKLTVGRKAHSERLNIHIKDRDLSEALAEYFNILWKRGREF